MCSDPEDPSPTCEGRDRPIGAVYDNPIVSGYINIITLPEPLDEGLIPDSLARKISPKLIPICYYDPTLYTAYQSDIDGWAEAREFFGTIDPFEPGPLTGTSIDILQSVQAFLSGYDAVCGSYCLQNPWIGELIGLVYPFGTVLAITYNILYDQYKETGPYSSLPLNPDKWTSKQKFYVTAAIVIIIIGAPP